MEQTEGTLKACSPGCFISFHIKTTPLLLKNLSPMQCQVRFHQSYFRQCGVISLSYSEGFVWEIISSVAYKRG